MSGIKSALKLTVAAIGVMSSTASVGSQAPSLRDEIARIALTTKGTLGVAALNLANGSIVEVNAEERFKMASTFKVAVAAHALHLAEANKVRLDEALPVKREDMLEPGILAEHFRHPGVALSTLNAIELSITVSDNGATDIIYQRTGGPAAANEWLRSRGHGDINLGTRTVKETFSQSGPADLEAEALARTTTPRAMMRFLADLYQGKLLEQKGRALLLEIMGRTAGDRLSLFLPPGTKVLHKTGTLFGNKTLSVNDVGYVTTPGGEVIVMVVFIKDSPEAVSHATRDRAIGHVGRAIYDLFQLR